MCLQPITILNPTKYVSIKHRDRFLLQVPCGDCAECQSNKSNEWLYRTYVEFVSCITENPNNFVMFDTLTYDDAHLPHIDELVKMPEGVKSPLPHYPCFRQSDLTKFFKSLRITLTRKYSDISVRYFVASEYGSLRHRPHYHILLSVRGIIHPYEMSKLIASLWKNGRTDGIPYQSYSYVMTHNVVQNTTIGEMLRTANYVTKYVQKNCSFQRLIDIRVKQCDAILSDDNYPFKKRGSVAYDKLREKMKSSINQFHLQSLGYGESALSNLDLNQIFADGYFLMPHFKGLKIPIAIPTYYKRKLFYDLVEINGVKCWCITDLGKKYKQAREKANLENLISRFKCASILLHENIDAVGLADYVLNYRGRYKADKEESTIVERLESSSITHYPYLTRTDKENIGIGISESYLGNSKLGYTAMVTPIKVSDFIEQYVYVDADKEETLKRIYSVVKPIADGKQAAYELEQRLRDLYKTIGF